MVTVLGIDPGLAAMGVALVRYGGKKPELVEWETIRTASASPTHGRWFVIAHALGRFLDRTSVVVDAIGMEDQLRVRVGKDRAGETNASALTAVQTMGLVYGLARWRAPGCPRVYEVQPADVKAAVLGRRGRSASKRQVMRGVEAVFGWPSLDEHASDAAAVALYVSRVIAGPLGAH